MQSRSRNRAYTLVILALTALSTQFAEGATGAAPMAWQQLPTTPNLPSDTVGSRVLLNGSKIWYADWATGTAQATPVLLLHGGYANSNYFGNLIPVLREHGYRVIAMDSRGHGRSTRSPAELTYDLMAKDVIALLDELKIRKVTIVGWSDGGIIGLDIAIHHPERLAGLFAFAANADPSGVKSDVAGNPVFSAYLARAKVEYAQLSPTPGDWPTFDAAINKMWETLPHFTPVQLQSIKIATEIADGQYDEAIKSEHTHYLAATIPNAKLLILPDVSHFAMVQNPVEFNQAVLTFLNSRWSHR
jgi:pimeloyl-ACP methyl ester carboxylesterase